jgi:hypothetical protein
MSEIDCSQCKGKDCCGLIGFPLAFVKEHEALGEKDMIEKVIQQDNKLYILCKDSRCVFLNRETGLCKVYNDRLEVCKIYGYDPRLPCPYFRADGVRRGFQERKITQMMIDKTVDDTFEKLKNGDEKKIDKNYIKSECDSCGKITKVKRYGQEEEYTYCDSCAEEIERGN